MPTLSKTEPNKSHKTNMAEKIRLAIIRIEKQRTKNVKAGRKLSVTSVAEEAGTTRANIYNNYPQLAEQIQQKTNKGVKAQRDKKQTELKILREKYRTIKKDLEKYKQLNQSLASEQAKLIVQLDHLNAIAKSENVQLIPTQKR